MVGAVNLLAPFTGVLYLPDKQFLAGGTPVLLANGQPVASIVWHGWTSRFEVLDASGRPAAICHAGGIFRRQYTATLPSGQHLLSLKPGAWRLFNGAELTLASGRSLAVRQMSAWSNRKFEFHAQGSVVGRILPTTGTFSFRPDSYAFELFVPVMSAAEAICLAQALRYVARAQRAAAA